MAERNASVSSGRSGRAWSWKREAESSSPPQETSLKPETYSVYRLKWEKLRAFLEEKFPECKGKLRERQVGSFQPCLGLAQKMSLVLTCVRRNRSLMTNIISKSPDI